MPAFQVVSEYTPSGDQPQAIAKLAQGIEDGLREQILLGVTGSGKTFTMAKTIEAVQKPTLVMAPNKTLAAQLAAELKEFFPDNAVVYFVSYYDYYQPEAYVPASDTFIEKDASINEEVEKLRHAATSALLSRRDVIVVASVSCIYGIGSPMDYAGMAVFVDKEKEMDRDQVIHELIDIQYDRNDYEQKRGTFRVRGDALDVFPPYADHPIRIEFWGDEIESIDEIDQVTGEVLSSYEALPIWPASHYVTARPKMDKALVTIQDELRERLMQFKEEGKLLEAQRLEMRVNYDLEMLETMGFCSGIENYSRYFDGRSPGEAPFTLMDFFPKDYLLFVDESHVTLPQVRAMYNGDKARKEMLIKYGFRLPAAADNRPLKFDEFNQRINQAIYLSATPAEYEREKAKGAIVEQIVRPTGLLDPEVIIRPVENQLDDLLAEINKVTKQGLRVLVTTLTKKLAERLTDYYSEMGVRVKYMHSDIDTMERIDIIRGLRLGEFDVLVGINLLREGLDIPEVALVAILDADKEGFLRNETSLIQTIGRAARNAEGRVILYADVMTGSIKRAVGETDRRRALQQAYNEKHGITPKSVVKEVNDKIDLTEEVSSQTSDIREINRNEKNIKLLEKQMKEAAAELDFEIAAALRDRIRQLKGEL